MKKKITEEMIKEIKEHLEAGEAYADEAKLFGVHPNVIGRMLTNEEKERYAKIRVIRHAKEAKEARRIMKYAKAHKTPVQVRINKPKQSYLTMEDVGAVDLWDYPNDYKKYGYKDLVVENGLFGISTQNIPFVNFQPAKRIQTISQGLMELGFDVEPETIEHKEIRLKTGHRKGNRIVGADKYIGKKLWYARWKWVDIVKPNIPLIDVARHDIDTLNATIGFVDNDSDRLLTQEDSCFISHSFAQRFEYTTQHKAVFFTKEPMDKNKERKVQAGECIEKIEHEEQLTVANTVKYSGTYRISKQRQKGNLWINYGLISSQQTLVVGDKLLGLTGLKVTICEIRANQVKDIVIHPKQIISKGKKAIKGAMVKELQECGKVMVGMRADEVLGAKENLTKGGSISIGLYPVLKLYAPKMLRKIIQENSVITELLKVLHLGYDNGTIKLTRKRADGSDLAGHYLWDAKLLKDKRFFSGKAEDYQVETLDRSFASEEDIEKYGETYNQLGWENLYLPQFTLTGYVRKGQWEDAFYWDYIAHTFDRNFTETKHNGKFPFIANYRKTEGVKESKNEFNKIVPNTLFCEVKTGMFLRALPTVERNKIIVSSKYKKKLGSSCLIFREPLVSKNNVFSVNVSYDDNLSPYCVRIPIELVKTAFGDFDGDGWAVAPYNDSNLNISSHKIKHVEPDMTTIDIDNMELVERTNTEMIAEAIEHRKNKTEEGRLTIEYGGRRNKASMYQESKEVQKKILDLAEYLEVILKREKHGDEWESTIEDKIKQLRQLIPARIREKKIPYGKWNIHDLYERRWDTWKGLVGYKPSGFWMDLFNIPQSEFERTWQAIARNKSRIFAETGEKW